jgi:hypothetical protein
LVAGQEQVRKGGETMADEAEIKSILLELGLYSLAMAYVGSEKELFKLFKGDFEELMQLCAQ